MEKSEEELLISRHFDLCKLTLCNTELLNILYEKRILQQTEVEDIESKGNNFAKAAEFYKTVRKKAGAFYTLLEGLAATNQTGTISILKEMREDDEEIIREAQIKVMNWIRTIPSLTKSGLSESLSKIKSGIAFDIHEPVHNFVGRIDELAKLHEVVLRNKNAKRISVISQLTSISGLGGIGKTQLAREYVNGHGSDFDGNIIWVNADTEKSLSDSFQRLASETLHISTRDGHGKEKEAKVIAQEVYKCFEGCKVLFVLDNAEKVLWLKDFMPLNKINPNLYLLITSRDREWNRGIEVMELGEFSEEDAVTLVQQELKINTDDKILMEEVYKLVKTLQYFPLALQQAVAYISEQQITSSYSISDYLVDFETKKLDLLSFYEKDTLCDGTFEATTATTWSITMDKIKQDPNYKLIAIQIMNIIAYLNPDKINRAIFYQLPLNLAKFEEKVDTDLVKGAVRLLVRYSMLNARENQCILSVHRLVQEVTRCKLADDGMEEKVLNFTLKIFSDKKCLEEFIDNAMIVWMHAFKYKGLLEAHSGQVSFILMIVCDIGHQQQGILFGRAALKIFSKYFGENSSKSFQLERYIANILKNQGYYEKATEILNKLLGKITRVFKKQQQQVPTILVLSDMGDALRLMEKYDEAIQVQERALELAAMFDETHDETQMIQLMTENNYAMSLIDSGRKKEALEVFQKLATHHISKGDTKSLKLLKIQAYIAEMKEEDDPNEAELIFKKILESFASNWTEDVRFYGYLCAGLGRTLINLERYDETLEILEESLVKIKQIFGDRHYRTLFLMGYISIAYYRKGELKKALRIQEKVHKGFLHIFGEDSLDRKFLAEHKNYAILLSKLGHHEESFKIFEKALSNMKGLANLKKIAMPMKWAYALAIERSGENLSLALKLLNEVNAACKLESQSNPENQSVVSQLPEIQMDIERIKRKLG